LFFLYGIHNLLLWAALAINEGTPPNPAENNASAPDFKNTLLDVMVFINYLR
jgi:hypothetical protein